MRERTHQADKLAEATCAFVFHSFLQHSLKEEIEGYSPGF